MKKIFSLVLFTIIILGLTGCGKSVYDGIWKINEGYLGNNYTVEFKEYNCTYYYENQIAYAYQGKCKEKKENDAIYLSCELYYRGEKEKSYLYTFKYENGKICKYDVNKEMCELGYFEKQ